MTESEQYSLLTAWVEMTLDMIPDRKPETPFERLFDKITDAMERYEIETLPPPLGRAPAASKVEPQDSSRAK